MEKINNMMPYKKTFMEKLLLTYLPFVGLIAMVVSYVPQLMLTYTTKNVEGQSLMFWVLLTIGLLSMLLQQVGFIKYNGVKTKMGLIFQGLNTLLALAMLVGVLIFS